jgi:hypothetical protein
MSRSVLEILKRWASAFNIELAMSDSPAEAQARAAVAFTEAASAVGLRLTERGPGELDYRPIVQWLSSSCSGATSTEEDDLQVRAA